MLKFKSLLGKTLREMGFSVDLVENASQNEMKKRIDLFGRKLQLK